MTLLRVAGARALLACVFALLIVAALGRDSVISLPGSEIPAAIPSLLSALGPAVLSVVLFDRWPFAGTALRSRALAFASLVATLYAVSCLCIYLASERLEPGSPAGVVGPAAGALALAVSPIAGRWTWTWTLLAGYGLLQLQLSSQALTIGHQATFAAVLLVVFAGVNVAGNSVVGRRRVRA